MTAPSTRHLPLLLGLSALLLFPLVRSRFEPKRLDDCAVPTALQDLSGLPDSGAKRERYERYNDDLIQWSELDLLSADPKTKLKGAMIRSFRPVGLYTRPPGKLLGSVEAGQRHIEWVGSGEDRLPIQTFYDRTTRRSVMASYLFIYGGKAVEHPVLAQLLSAPEQVWNGTRPLTLLMVAGEVSPHQRDAARENAKGWLVAAFERYRSVCTP